MPDTATPTWANCTQGGSASSSAPPPGSSGPVRGKGGVAGSRGDAPDSAATRAALADTAQVAAAVAAAQGPSEVAVGGSSPISPKWSQGDAANKGIAKETDDVVSQVLSVPSPNGSHTLDVVSDAASVERTVGRPDQPYERLSAPVDLEAPEAQVVAAAVYMAEAHILSVANQAVAAQADKAPLEDTAVLEGADSDQQHTAEPEERASTPVVASQPSGHAESAPGAEPSQLLGGQGVLREGSASTAATADAAALLSNRALLQPCPSGEAEVAHDVVEPPPEKTVKSAGGAAISAGECALAAASEADLAEERSPPDGPAHEQHLVPDNDGPLLSEACAGRPVFSCAEGRGDPITPAGLLGTTGRGEAAAPAAMLHKGAGHARHAFPVVEGEAPPPNASAEEGTREDAPENEPRRQGQHAQQDSAQQQQWQKQMQQQQQQPFAVNDEYVVQVNDVHNTGAAIKTAPLVGIGGGTPATHLLTVPQQDGDGENTLNSSAALLDLLGLGDASFLFRAVKTYCRWLAAWPGVFLCAYFALVAVFMLVRIPKWLDFDVDTDFHSFIQADGVAMRERQAYKFALDEKQGFGDSGRRLREATDIREERRHPGRQLGYTTLYAGRDLHIVYVSKTGDAFDARTLADIHDFERRLRANEGFRDMCGQAVLDHAGLCDPGWSLSAYTWPTTTSDPTAPGGTFTMHFDARGSDQLPLPAAFAYMQDFTAKFDPPLSSDVAPTDFRRFFPKDYETPPVLGDGPLGATRPKAIKSTFKFNIHLGPSTMSSSEIDAAYDKMKKEYQDVVAEKIWPFLAVAALEYDYVSIYYYGDEVTAHEIMVTLQNDALLAIASVSFVLVYLRLHTGDTLVSCFSLVIIFISVPMAYLITPMEKVTVASFLSLFVMMGVGSDVVFVFTDFWQQSKRLPDIRDRLVWMLLHAGRSCLATSMTTSVSFFANLQSALQALREFGLFMGLCVMNVFFLVVLFMPPLLVIVERRRVEWEQRTKVKPRTVDISAGETTTLAVVPTSSNSSGISAAATPKKKQQKSGPPNMRGGRMLLFKLVNMVGTCPLTILICGILTVVLWFYFVFTNAQLEDGAPDIFPSGHNQIESARWSEEFYEFNEKIGVHLLPPVGATACEPQAPADCDLYWCSMQSEPVYGPEHGLGGACWHGPVTDDQEHEVELSAVADTCVELTTYPRVASTVEPDAGDWQRAWEAQAEAFFFSGEEVVSSASGRISVLPHLAMEDWAPGTVSMVPLFQMPSTLLANSMSNGTTSCFVRPLCFLGLPACDLPADTVAMGTITLGTPSQSAAIRRLGQERQQRLQQLTGRVLQGEVPPRKQMIVTVLWGIRAAMATPCVGPPQESWSFDPTFEPSNPWAQRAIWAVCSDSWTRNGGVLQVVDTECWIDSFRGWLLRKNSKFPSRDFDHDVAEWWTTEPVLAPANIWMVGDVMHACRIEFSVNKPSDLGSAETLKYKDQWADFTDRMNAQASVTARFAYHTSQAWVRAEAEHAIVGSTKETIIISAVCGWLGVMLNTWNVLLAFLVTGLVLGIVVGLAFFMVMIMGWRIGPIEVIALVVFVGYSITYSLHIAQTYSEIEDNDKDALELEEIARSRKASAKKASAGSGPSRYTQTDELSAQATGLASTASPSSSGVRSACPSSGGSGCGSCNKSTAAVGKESRKLDASQMKNCEIRLARTRAAMLYVGGATWSSAVSTVGSSFFLLFCTLNIFEKLGLVVISVTILSITFAMVVVPAALICLGPLGETWYQRCWRRLAETSTARRLVQKWGARHPSDPDPDFHGL